MTLPEEQAAKLIASVLPKTKAGTLKVFGCWFGRPIDNVHSVVSAEAENGYLRLGFNCGEVLRIWSPRDLKVSHKVFKIAGAQKIKWEWFYYGRENTTKNLYFEEFEVQGDEVKFSSNVNWFDNRKSPSLSEAAVELV